MSTSGVEERRRELEALDRQLRVRVIEPIRAVWTPQLAAAAKRVVDSAPDELARASMSLQQRLAAYRIHAAVDGPVAPLTEAAQAVDAAAEGLGAELTATAAALLAAKTFKSQQERATIDEARDAIEQAAVALTAWRDDLRRFDG